MHPNCHRTPLFLLFQFTFVSHLLLSRVKYTLKWNINFWKRKQVQINLVPHSVHLLINACTYVYNVFIECCVSFSWISYHFQCNDFVEAISLCHVCLFAPFFLRKRTLNLFSVNNMGILITTSIYYLYLRPLSLPLFRLLSSALNLFDLA